MTTKRAENRQQAAAGRLLVTAAGALAFAGLAQGAAPGEFVINQELPFSFALSPGYQYLDFQQFDDQGGTRNLQSVTLHLNASAGADVAVGDASSLPAEGASVSLAGILAAAHGDLFALINISETAEYTGPVTGGETDTPTSGDTWSFGYVLSANEVDDVLHAELSAYVGDDTIEVAVYGAAGFTFTPAPSEFPWTIHDFGAEGTVTVTYTYTLDPVTCDGDIDGDGVVGFTDLLAVLNAWGACPVIALCPEDVQPSGLVDTADLIQVLSAWGPCPSVSEEN